MSTDKPTWFHPAEYVLRPGEQELYIAWRELVEANAEQVARLREFEEPEDYWAEGFAGTTVSLGPGGKTDQGLARLADPRDRWLDIGAGYGRTTVPLSQHVERVTAIEPSPGVTKMLIDHVNRLGIENIDVLGPSAWPPDESPGLHDVCVALNVIYFVAEIGPFLDAMEEHADRLCIVSATELGAAWQPVEPVFAELHGEYYIRPPALREFLALLGARRRRFDIQTHADLPPIFRDPQDLDSTHVRVRRHYLVQEGSPKDSQLRELLNKHFGVGDGFVHLPSPEGRYWAVVSWAPPD